MHIVTEKLIIDNGFQMRLEDAQDAVRELMKNARVEKSRMYFDRSGRISDNADKLTTYLEKLGIVEIINGPDFFYADVLDGVRLARITSKIKTEPL